MSIWKFRLYFIPEQGLFARYETLPFSLPVELAEEYDWWVGNQPPVGFERQIEATLPRMESWSKSARMWGWKEIGGDAQVWYTNDDHTTVEEIQFRIDSRAVSDDLIRLTCELARRLKCVLMTSEYKIVVPDEPIVRRAFRESTAAKFMVDPVGTLEALDTDEIQRRADYGTKEQKKQ